MIKTGAARDSCWRKSKVPFFIVAVSPTPHYSGGGGYSIFPDTALAYLEADMGIQGEGEYAFPELLKRLEKGWGLRVYRGCMSKAAGYRARAPSFVICMI